MARRVFFHIGAPKSGTTFLQTLMWTNRELLADRGLLYPGRRRFDHYLAHEYVRWPDRRTDEVRAAWDRVVGPVADWPGDVLISHEFFSALRPGQVRRLVAQVQPTEIEVVCTVRDYVRAFPSVWFEALKMGSPRSFDGFLDDMLGGDDRSAWSWRTQDVPKILRQWSSAVSPDRVHVVTVPPAGGPSGVLWSRWCAAIGIDGTSLVTDVALPNESLGVRQSALLLRAQQHLTDPLLSAAETHRWFRGYFAQEILARQPGTRFGMSARHAEAFGRLSAQAADALAEAGYQVHGDLDDLRPQPPYPELPSPDDVSEHDQLDVAAIAIDALLHDVRELTVNQERLRRQLAEAQSIPAQVAEAGRRRRWGSNLPEAVKAPLRRARAAAGRLRRR